MQRSIERNVEDWARRHGYKIINRAKYKPNLIVIGELHGLFGIGKFPDFIKSQIELIRMVKPTAIALEREPESEETLKYIENNGIPTKFEELSDYTIKNPSDFFTTATLVDLHNWVCNLDYAGKLDDENARKKILSAIARWPENIYEEEARKINAGVYDIDNHDLYQDSIRLVERGGRLGFKFHLLTAARSSYMEICLSVLQQKERLTVAIMGQGHLEHILIPPFYYDNKRMVAVDQTIVNPREKFQKKHYVLGTLIAKSIREVLTRKPEF